MPIIDRKRRAIIVLGMHRSGTSALAGVLGLLGARLPARQLPANFANPKGYFEPNNIVAIHDRILVAAGTTWSGWEEIPQTWFLSEPCRAFVDELVDAVSEDYGTTDLCVIKDPRMCRLMPLWHRVLEKIGVEACFAIPFRNPVEVAKSIHIRDGMPLAQGCLLWLRHVLDAERNTRRHPRVFLRYSDLLAGPRSVIGRMRTGFGVAWPRPLKSSLGEIEEFLDPSLRTQIAHERDIDDMGDFSPWLRQAYECYEALERSPIDRAARRQLDSLHAAFAASDAAFTPVFKHQAEQHAIELAVARSRVVELENAVEATQASLAEKAREAVESKGTLQVAQSRVLELESDVEDWSKQVRALEVERATLHAQLVGSRAAFAEQARDASRLQELLHTARSRVNELEVGVEVWSTQARNLEADRASIGARLAETQASLAKKAREAVESKGALQVANEEIARLYRSRSWRWTKPLRALRHASLKLRLALRGWVSDYARSLYRTMPMPLAAKIWIKSTLFSIAPPLFRHTLSYRSWLVPQRAPAPAAAGSLITDSHARSQSEGVPAGHVGAFGPDSIVPLPINEGPLQVAPSAQLIAFYLPQFHPIPENDRFWGKGFTEWTNVTRATPQFVGHYQPRLPGDLGFYDLRLIEVQRRQVELAKLYGIGGFCFYFYWFNGQRLLEKPLEQYLANAELDLPFCLCWANENWTRVWDGRSKEVLIEQQNSPQDDLAFIQHLARYLADPRYIRVKGKPLVIVYRPELLTAPRKTAKRWRSWCREQGLGEIYLAYVQSFESVDPAKYGFDAAIEFPPNGSALPNITDSVSPLGEDFGCTVYDWRAFVDRSENYRQPNYKLYRTVCPMWDNTARRMNRGTVFLNSTPALYQRWLENAVRHTVQSEADPDVRLIFVNAWNEWAEGAYLEPDARYGYAYLQATRDALCNTAGSQDKSILLVSHDCHPHGAQFLLLAMAKQLKSDGFTVGILTLGGGKLLADFTRIGRTLNAEGASEQSVQEFLADLRARGTLDAITSTVVSGCVLPQLKNLGFRVLSLVHELPGVIRDMKQESNAATIARLADKVIFAAKLVHRRFCEIAPVTPDKVVILPQGVLRKNPYKNRRVEAHHEICEKHRLSLDTQIVVSVAYADSRKGADLFVEIAAQVLKEQPKTVFIWIGHADREMERKVTALIQKHGLQERVLFIGFDGEPMAYYAAASVYALPSREDPFPNVVLESAEVGVPVVAFQGTSGAEDFIVEQGGRLARYLDTADFARQTCDLLVRPARKAQNNVSSLRQYTLDLLHHLNGFPRISVIVPNYNYERYITRRLDSIYRQTFPIYEVIVLDDASSDHSVEVIEEYLERSGSEAQLVANGSNSGSVFRQWQKGIARCKGDLVWIAEADDLADSHFLSQLSAAFHDAEVVLAFTQSKQIDENGKVLAQDYLKYTEDVSDRWLEDYVRDGREEISESLSIKNTIPNVSAVLFNRRALEHALAGIGDDLYNYRVAGDWLIYLHVLLQGKVYYSAKPLNLHRRHTSSITNSIQALTHLQEVRRLQEIAWSLVEPSEKVPAKAIAYINNLYEYFGIPNIKS